MFSALTNLINDIALGPENRKVKKYLDEATCSSVSRDFNKVLLSQLSGFKERKHLQDTFDRHCIESSNQQAYWNEGSFRAHVRNSHSESSISDTSIQLLWGCFHFYAHHPFPQLLQNGIVEFDQFQRAILLTAFHCDDLLGTRELEWFWRKDAAFFRKASFERMFRSLAVAETTSQLLPSRQQQDATTPSFSDLMDVLIMVIPQFMHAAPSPNQLEIVARKLLPSDQNVATQVEVKRATLSTLIDLLLRVSLSEEKWAPVCHTGYFAEINSADDQFVKVLVDSLAKDGNDQNIVSTGLGRAAETMVSLMPNLQERFCQLWAVLFQPPVSKAAAKVPRVPEAGPAHVNGAISLFAPQLNIESRYYSRAAGHDSNVKLQRGPSTTSDSHTTTITHLIRSLSYQSAAYVVLFSDPDGITTTLTTVIGVYFPGPVDVKEDTFAEVDTEKKLQSNTAHLIFQLKPSFRLLASLDSPRIGDLIRAPDSTRSLADIWMSKGSESLDLPYWIGNGTRENAGINVDPRRNMAMLVASDNSYRELGTVEGKEASEGWTVTVHNPRMDVYMVTNSGSWILQT